MGRKKWRHDGPVVATMLQRSWVMFSSIMQMSAAAGRSRAEVEVLRDFLRAHPEHIPTEREMLNPGRALTRLHDLMKRHEDERQRRLKALINHADKHKRKAQR
jgi:hypothetical protein